MNTQPVPSSVLGLGPDDLGKALRVTLASGVDMVGTLTQIDALRFPVDGMLTITIGPLDVHVMASQVACWSFIQDNVDAPLTVASLVEGAAV